jgi:hypothetical protein
MSLGSLNEKYATIIDEIYRKGNGEYLKGREANEFFNKLLILSQASKNKGDIYLQKF